MFYVTGDIHGNVERLSFAEFYKGKELKRSDYVMICGDFGGVWDNSKGENARLDWLAEKPFTVLFVDGNHENFDLLEKYPVEMWNGGKVHFIRENIIHLMRGQVYNIDGHKIFTMGGAASHDIKDGVLDPDDYVDEDDFRDKYRWMRSHNKMFRVKGVSWWEQEMPNSSECREAMANLAANDYKVDYIFTHCCATSTLSLMGHSHSADVLNTFFEELRSCVQFKRWYFGHMHQDRIINDREICMYYSFDRLW